MSEGAISKDSSHFLICVNKLKKIGGKEKKKNCVFKRSTNATNEK